MKPRKIDLLLSDLQSGMEISGWYAMHAYGLYSLSQACGDLRKKGFDVININEGTGTYGLYKLRGRHA